MDRSDKSNTSNITTSTTAAATTATTSTANSLTVEELDIEILPIIYEIIRCFEKDPTDNASKQRESHDCSAKVLELQRRLDSARSQIKRLVGIDYNKEEQLQRLESLHNQLQMKQQLIKKYRNFKF